MIGNFCSLSPQSHTVEENIFVCLALLLTEKDTLEFIFIEFELYAVKKGIATRSSENFTTIPCTVYLHLDPELVLKDTIFKIINVITF